MSKVTLFPLPTALWMRSSEPLRQQDGCSFGNLLSKSSSTSITRVQVPFNQRNSPSRNVANQTLWQTFLSHQYDSEYLLTLLMRALKDKRIFNKVNILHYNKYVINAPNVVIFNYITLILYVRIFLKGSNSALSEFMSFFHRFSSITVFSSVNRRTSF